MATRKKTTKKKAPGGRGSAQAIAKRRAARQLNTLLAGGGKGGARLDGRTEKRRKRLIKELKGGRAGRPIKPIDFVSHVDELLAIGETLTSLKKQGVKPRHTEQTPEVLTTALQTQKAYAFRPKAWKMLGIDLESTGKRGGTRRKARGKTTRARKRR